MLEWQKLVEDVVLVEWRYAYTTAKDKEQWYNF